MSPTAQDAQATGAGEPPPVHAKPTAAVAGAGAATGEAADVAIEDWEDLFNAVKSRLRQLVGDAQPQRFNGSAAPIQAQVLECVAALDQLQATLAHTLARLRAPVRTGADVAQDSYLRRQPGDPAGSTPVT